MTTTEDNDQNAAPASGAPPITTPLPPQEVDEAKPIKPRRRRIIVKRSQRGGGAASARKSRNDVPESISKKPALLSAISSSLPLDYEFEIPKTLHRIQTAGAVHVALQLPEGLLMYACSIADILRRFTPPGICDSVSILGDVTYGACCVDDLGAKALGADLLVHYGHSCLVPINETEVPCLYIFVEIRIDVQHCVDCFCKTCPVGTKVFVMGTVQVRLNRGCARCPLFFRRIGVWISNSMVFSLSFESSPCRDDIYTNLHLRIFRT